MARQRDEDSLEEKLSRMVAESLDPSSSSDDDPQLVEARASFEGFVRYVMPDYEMNWHHQVFCDAIERWVKGLTHRLMLFAPPQAGKSLLVSRLLPAYLFGLNPDEAIVASSFNGEYATKNNVDVQRIIESDRYAQVFPFTRIASDEKGDAGWKRNARLFEIVARKGIYFCGGVRTGSRCLVSNSAVIDDLYKDDKDANSPTIQEAVFNWYVTVFLARKSRAGARILIINTRWSMRDLCGTLLDMAAKDPKADQWEVVSFPALLESEEQRNPGDNREIGEALWPSRQSRKELENTRAISGTSKWSCVYQQNPTPDKGVFFARDNFRYFSTEMDRDLALWLVLDDGNGDEPRRFLATDCLWYQTCDAADTTGVRSDYTAVGTFARTPDADLCAWHYWRGKVEYPKRYKAVTSLRDGCPEEGPWPVPLAFQSMENKASGTAMIQQAAADGRPFRPLKPGTSNKAQRAATLITMYENRKVFHRQGRMWGPGLEAELINFPGGRFDDGVDVCSYAAIVSMQQSSAYQLQGELIVGAEMPRDADGRISLRGTSLDPNPGTYRICGIDVQFDDD
jgi:predicted phage terminase large subunit-like protein